MTGAEQTPQEQHAADCSWKVMPAPGEEPCDGGCMPTPQERLAMRIYQALDGELNDWGACHKQERRDKWEAVAAAILDSDVIREMRQQDRREAWAEGRDSQDVHDSLIANPYDQKASDGLG